MGKKNNRFGLRALISRNIIAYEFSGDLYVLIVNQMFILNLFDLEIIDFQKDNHFCALVMDYYVQFMQDACCAKHKCFKTNKNTFFDS